LFVFSEHPGWLSLHGTVIPSSLQLWYMYSKNHRGSGNGYNSEFAMQHNACGTSSVTTSDCSLVAMFSMHCSHAFAAAAVDDGQVLQI